MCCPNTDTGDIGKELLNTFETAGRLDAVKMYIGIVKENLVLKKMHEKFGFAHLGTKKPDCFRFDCGYMQKQL